MSPAKPSVLDKLVKFEIGKTTRIVELVTPLELVLARSIGVVGTVTLLDAL
jgi:hypothetical protein